MGILIFLLVVAAIIIGFLTYQLIQKRQQLKRYQGIADIESEQARIRKEIETEQTKAKNEAGIQAEENARLRKEGLAIRHAVSQLKAQLENLEEEQFYQEHGLYKPRYDFDSSEQYQRKLDEIRESQKQVIKNKRAVLWGQQWTVDGSASKGKTMMNQRTRLMLRAFNGECDSLILKVKYNNIQRIEDRLRKAYESLNNLSKADKASISEPYLNLKIQELHLVHEYQEKLQAEKEEQREIREQMREEQRAQKELEQAQRDAEKEEARYQKALDRARKEMEQATGEAHDKLQAEIEQLQQQLAEAHENKERAISRAQMTRSGHVYIVSNIGSFGENVYKIGLTRRLEPMDRVKELGDASVPFSFDVHAMIYSEDAPALESYLHNEFDRKRLNLVNNRKEFFRVSLDEIVKVVKEKTSAEVKFTMKAEAEEYRKTKALLVEMTRKPNEEDKPEEMFADVLGA